MKKIILGFYCCCLIIPLPSYVTAECCPYSQIVFDIVFPDVRYARLLSISDVIKKKTFLNNKIFSIHLEVCGDGKIHDGFFCGVGKCNMFGCQCNRGCYKGDAVKSFQKIHAGIVDNVRLTNTRCCKV